MVCTVPATTDNLWSAVAGQLGGEALGPSAPMPYPVSDELADAFGACNAVEG
jgi:hypothetical protein